MLTPECPTLANISLEIESTITMTAAVIWQIAILGTEFGEFIVCQTTNETRIRLQKLQIIQILVAGPHRLLYKNTTL